MQNQHNIIEDIEKVSSKFGVETINELCVKLTNETGKNDKCSKILSLTKQIEDIVFYGVDDDLTKVKSEIIKRLTANCLEARNIISEKDEEIQKLKETVEWFGAIINIAAIQWNPIKDNIEEINKKLKESIDKELNDCGFDKEKEVK
jgi:hypothetical protein